MKSLLYIFLSFIIVMNFAGNSYAQIFPTYELKVKNLHYGSLNYPNDAIYFDIAISHTNGGVTNFEYVGGQFHFDFNPGIFTGTWPPASGNDTSQYSYKIIGSHFPVNFVPRSPQIFGNQANQLRLAVNNIIGHGEFLDLTNAIDTIIVKMRLWNKTGSFNQVPLGLLWRNTWPVPFTKIFSYVGTTMADISTPSTHTIEVSGNPLLDGQLMAFPENNAGNVSTETVLKWNKWPKTDQYKIQVSTSSGLTNLLIDDSTRTDTTKILSGLECLTNYYWRVAIRDSSGRYYYPNIWKFTTGAQKVMRIKLTLSFEGKYNPDAERLESRDTMVLLLRNVNPPYQIIDSSRGVIDSISFSNIFEFPYRPSGNYYLVVKHPQSIETWSKIGGETLNGDCSLNGFDFTRLRSNAYGNNQAVKWTKYCIFSGDINQDNIIDGSDMAIVRNSMNNLTLGYSLSDLNGDLIVDGSDLQIVDNNAYLFISLVSPISP